MRTCLVRTTLIVLAIITLAPRGVALAHGEPVIAVEPGMVAAGETITVTGSEMEPGEVFAITLEGLSGSIPLGEATVSGEGEEGGFVAPFTIPSDTAPGSYTVRAATDKGESAAADLTVTAPIEEADAGPAVIREATGEQHPLDRPKPLGQIVGVAAIALLNGLLGLWLIRRPG